MKKLTPLALASLALAACSDRPSPVAPAPVPARAAAIAPAQGNAIAGHRFCSPFARRDDSPSTAATLGAGTGASLSVAWR